MWSQPVGHHITAKIVKASKMELQRYVQHIANTPLPYIGYDYKLPLFAIVVKTVYRSGVSYRQANIAPLHETFATYIYNIYIAPACYREGRGELSADGAV